MPFHHDNKNKYIPRHGNEDSVPLWKYKNLERKLLEQDHELQYLREMEVELSRDFSMFRRRSFKEKDGMKTEIRFLRCKLDKFEKEEAAKKKEEEEIRERERKELEEYEERKRKRYEEDQERGRLYRERLMNEWDREHKWPRMRRELGSDLFTGEELERLEEQEITSLSWVRWRKRQSCAEVRNMLIEKEE